MSRKGKWQVRTFRGKFYETLTNLVGDLSVTFHGLAFTHQEQQTLSHKEGYMGDGIATSVVHGRETFVCLGRCLLVELLLQAYAAVDRGIVCRKIYPCSQTALENNSVWKKALEQ